MSSTPTSCPLSPLLQFHSSSSRSYGLLNLVVASSSELTPSASLDVPPPVLALAGFRHGGLLREVDEEEEGAELEKRVRRSLTRRGTIGKQVQRIMAEISASLGGVG